MTTPYHLVSLYLAGTSPPPRENWKSKKKQDGSRFIRDVTFPDGTLVKRNQHFKKIWEIANTGDVVWIGRKLVCQDQGSMLFRKIGESYIALNYSLIPDRTEIQVPDTKPGECVMLEVNFAAPNAPAWVVSYWKMVGSNGEPCFPDFEGLKCCVNVMDI